MNPSSTAVLDGTGTDTGEPLCDEAMVVEEVFDADAIPQDDTNFPLAVMAGQMQPDSFMGAVWVADATPVTLRVWRETAVDGTVAIVHEAQITPDADGYAKPMVAGLCPGTWYRYAYFRGDPGAYSGRSQIGDVRTALAADALEPLTIAMTACPGASLQWPALERTAEQYYDIFLHLGDMVYADGSVTSEDYRQVWRSYLAAPGYRAALPRAGMYVTWDDHEIDDNSNFDRETRDPAELARKATALDSFFEVLPVEGGGPDYQLWRSFRWGLTAEIILLDCRYERQPSQSQYISPEQMQWLTQRLLDSPCHFKIIMNSVPITDMQGGWDLAAADRWDGYPDQRAELLSFIDDNDIRGVWFVSGDFHVCFVSRLEADGTSTSARMREISVTGGNINPFNDAVAPLAAPQFDYGVKLPRGCLLDFDPEADEVRVRFLDPDTGMADYDEILTQD